MVFWNFSIWFCEFFSSKIISPPPFINRFWIHRKDYETGRLNSGLLQLAPHTHLILDETRLEPGKLENSGIQAVGHVSNLIRKQQLNVNFKFYSIDYNANVPVLILSEGKSMFPVSHTHVIIFRNIWITSHFFLIEFFHSLLHCRSRAIVTFHWSRTLTPLPISMKHSQL